MNHDAISVIETHIQQKREEIERLQRDLAALERTLAILRGNHVSEHQSRRPPLERVYSVPQERYPQLAQTILRERGSPLTGDQIAQIAISQDKAIKRTSLMGALYRCTKGGKLFKLVAPGTFGLLEWENHSAGREESSLGPLQDVTGSDDSLHESAPSEVPNGAL